MPLLHGVSGISIGYESKMIPRSPSERNVIYGRPHVLLTCAVVNAEGHGAALLGRSAAPTQLENAV